MNFLATALPGVFIIEPERLTDERGFFARSWCQQEFAAHGLATSLVQSSISFNAKRGTMRGMHYQAAPHAETKVVRCTMGTVYDVVLDLRHPEAGYPWIGVELSAENRRSLYIPEGCAHGFVTLTDDCELLYQMTEVHHPQSSRRVNCFDPAFNIEWPLAALVMSEPDRNCPFVSTIPALTTSLAG